MKIKYSIALFCLSFLALNSCKKEGPVGPAGKDGNANVISSNTVTINNWTSTFDNGTEFNYSTIITWPSITQAIKDNGIVMIYMHDNTTTNWTALPYSESGTGYSDALNFEIALGQTTISFEGVDNSGSPGASALNGFFTFRLVAIPSSARKANPDLDWKNYNAVKTALNLKD
jgi:hypothetical protein